MAPLLIAIPDPRVYEEIAAILRAPGRFLIRLPFLTIARAWGCLFVIARTFAVFVSALHSGGTLIRAVNAIGISGGADRRPLHAVVMRPIATPEASRPA